MSDLRFDVEAYRERLGEKAFLRHHNYLNGEVTLIGIDGGGAVAHVSGSGEAPYVAELGEGGYEFCSCPAFQEAGVCKHLPAVAHTVNGLSDEQRRRLIRRLDRLRETLSFDAQAVLIERIVGLAKAVPGVIAALEAVEEPD